MHSNTVSHDAATIAQMKEKKDFSFAKQGLIFALISGVIWSFDGLSLEEGMSFEPFTLSHMWILGPLLAAGLHDFFAGIVTLIANIRKGQAKEIMRTMVSKPGRLCILGACLGAPLGMGGYLMAVSLAGPAYILPITSLYPAIAAILAWIFLKERISKRAWGGLLLCVCGAIVIGYTPPASNTSEFFYLGIACAFIASMGWAAEGVCVTSGMDFVHPTVALNIYQISSALIYAFIIIPAISIYIAMSDASIPVMSLICDAVCNINALAFIAAAGAIGSISYQCWYRAMNMTGVARSMALNITYALWGIVFSAIFTDIEITKNLIIGAIVVFMGMFLVIGNPKEIVNLRNVE